MNFRRLEYFLTIAETGNLRHCEVRYCAVAELTGTLDQDTTASDDDVSGLGSSCDCDRSFETRHRADDNV